MQREMGLDSNAEGDGLRLSHGIYIFFPLEQNKLIF